MALEVVLPSIVAKKLPFGVEHLHHFVAEVADVHAALRGPLELSTATLVGVGNWPGPAPGMPAWQVVLFLQTSPPPRHP